MDRSGFGCPNKFSNYCFVWGQLKGCMDHFCGVLISVWIVLLLIIAKHKWDTIADCLAGKISIFLSEYKSAYAVPCRFILRLLIWYQIFKKYQNQHTGILLYWELQLLCTDLQIFMHVLCTWTKWSHNSIISLV